MKLTSIISGGFMSPKMTTLEKIVATRAVGNTIMTNLSKEFSAESMMFNLSSVYSIDVLFLSVIAIYAYHQYHDSATDKIADLPVYSRVSRTTKQIVFILFLIFTRDVNNAI